jgi:hypothetical protein
MNGQQVLFRRLLRMVRSAKDFKELSRKIMFSRKWKDRLSRSDQLKFCQNVSPLLVTARITELIPFHHLKRINPANQLRLTGFFLCSSIFRITKYSLFYDL